MVLSVNFVCIFQFYTIVRFPYKTLYIYAVRRCQIIIFTALKELEKAVYRPLISYVDCNNCLHVVGGGTWRKVNLLSTQVSKRQGIRPTPQGFLLVSNLSFLYLVGDLSMACLPSQRRFQAILWRLPVAESKDCYHMHRELFSCEKQCSPQAETSSDVILTSLHLLITNSRGTL